MTDVRYREHGPGKVTYAAPAHVTPDDAASAAAPPAPVAAAEAPAESESELELELEAEG